MRIVTLAAVLLTLAACSNGGQQAPEEQYLQAARDITKQDKADLTDEGLLKSGEAICVLTGVVSEEFVIATTGAGTKLRWETGEGLADAARRFLCPEKAQPGPGEIPG